MFFCRDKCTKLVWLVPCASREGELSTTAIERLFIVCDTLGSLSRFFTIEIPILLVLYNVLCLKYLLESSFMVLCIIFRWKE